MQRLHADLYDVLEGAMYAVPGVFEVVEPDDFAHMLTHRVCDIVAEVFGPKPAVSLA
jgi:hypothetical protein